MDICFQMTASEFEYPAATRGYLSSSGTPLRWQTSTERQHWPFVLERSLQLQPNHRKFLEFDRILGSAVDVLVHCGQVLSEISSVCASAQFLLSGKPCSKQQILAHMQGVLLYVGKVIFDFIGILTSWFARMFTVNHQLGDVGEMQEPVTWDQMTTWDQFLKALFSKSSCCGRVWAHAAHTRALFAAAWLIWVVWWDFTFY